MRLHGAIHLGYSSDGYFAGISQEIRSFHGQVILRGMCSMNALVFVAMCHFSDL